MEKFFLGFKKWSLLFWVIIVFFLPPVWGGVKKIDNSLKLKTSVSKISPVFFIPNKSFNKKGIKIIKENQDTVAFVQTFKGRVQFTAKGLYIGVPIANKSNSDYSVSKNKKFSNTVDDNSLDSNKLLVFGIGFKNRKTKKVKSVSPILENKTKTKVNFFIGTSDEWQTNVPTFEKLKYPEVWDNIDIEYIGYTDKIEYRMILKPGSDINMSEMETGAKRLIVNDDGSLIADFGDARLYMSKPYAYQIIDGQRKEVSVKYKILSNSTYSFELGSYDKTKTLIIDPVLSWSVVVGERGDGEDIVKDMVLDSSNNVYLVGYTNSSDFPTTPGVFNRDYSIGYDVFVSKLSADGSSLLFSVFLGGGNDDYGYSIDLDSSNNVYITGHTYSTDFPVSDGAYSQHLAGAKDIFVTKIKSDGSAIVYSTFLGGEVNDYGYSIKVDSSGNAYITGATYSEDFPVTDGAFDTTFGGSLDAYVVKLNSSGSALIYSTLLGGPYLDCSYSIAIDSDGCAYITGYTYSDDFPVTSGAYSEYNDWRDIFVTKLNSDGSGLVFSTFVGGSDDEEGWAIALNSSNEVCVVGITESSDFPMTTDSFDNSFNGDVDGYLIKLSNDGKNLLYSTFLGGYYPDEAHDVYVDSFDNIYIVGQTYSKNFPTTDGVFQPDAQMYLEAFVTKFLSNGSLAFSTYLGGLQGDDVGNAVAVDSSGNVYVAGYTNSKDFPTTNGVFDNTYNGNTDVFVTKLDFELKSLIFSTFLGGATGDNYIYSMAVDNTGSIYIVGDADSNNYPTTPGVYSETSSGGKDICLTKLNADGSVDFSTFIGGSGDDSGHAIVLDSSNNIYLTGYTESSDFPVTSGVYDENHNGEIDTYVLKINSDGDTLLFSTFIGGSSGEQGMDLALDRYNNIVVCGYTMSSDFPTTSGAFDTSFNGLGVDTDGFIVKLNNNGTELIFSTYIGGNSGDFLFGIDVDGNGDIYVTGGSYSSGYPITDNNVSQLFAGGSEIVITKLNSSGSELIYSTFVNGGANFDYGYDIVVNSDYSAYVTGVVESDRFATTGGVYDETYNGGEDAFLLKINSEGSDLISSTFIGGSGDERGKSLFVDNYGNVYITGYTSSSDFPVSPSTYDADYNGGTDAFIVKLNSDLTSLLFSTFIGGSGEDQGKKIAIDVGGNICVCGSTESSDFPKTIVNYPYSDDTPSAFVMKFLSQYIIEAEAEGAGTIQPSGTITVAGGSTLTFTMTPNENARIADVVVDGVSVGSVQTYTFENINTDHTIKAYFDESKCKITASAGEGGKIEPSGVIEVFPGENLTFQITPDEGYFVEDVIVDGSSVGRVNSYTFTDIKSDHTISATFTDSLPPIIESAWGDSVSAEIPFKTVFHCDAYDPDGGAIVQYVWEIEGDNFKDKLITEQNFCEYTFSNVGVFHVKVTVFDDEGESASAYLTDNSGNLIAIEANQLDSLEMPVPFFSLINATTKGLLVENSFTGIINVSNEEATVSIDFLDNAGNVVSSDNVLLNPNGKFVFDALSNKTGFQDVILKIDKYALVYSKVKTTSGQMTSYLLPLLTKALFIPHIAEEVNYWETGMFVVASKQTDVKIDINNDEKIASVGNTGNFFDLEQYIETDNINVESNWGSVASVVDNPFEAFATLSGFEIFQHNDTDGAAVELPSEGSLTLFIPHIPEETDLFWTGFILVNPNNEQANLTISLYDESGNFVKQIDLTLNPKTKFKVLASDLFEDAYGNAQWGIISSSKEIFGLEIYGTVKDGICGYLLPSNANCVGYFPEIVAGEGLWNGIALTNPFDQSVGININLVSSSGEVKATKQITLGAKQRFKVVLKDFFSDVEIDSSDYIFYNSTGPIIGIEVNGDLDRKFMQSLVGCR